jgi:predicted nucleotidyltransferase
MVTKKEIDIIKDCIVETTNPEKIILFGSYGRGAQTEESDLDILVIVKNSKELRYKRARNIRKKIWGLVSVPKDILVYTENEIKERQEVKYSFISNALAEGVNIYEKRSTVIG